MDTINLFIKSLDKARFLRVPKHIRKCHEREPDGWFGLPQDQRRVKLEQLALYLHKVIVIFGNDKKVKTSDEYQLLVRLFNEQCKTKKNSDSEGDDNDIQIKKKAKGESLQSASICTQHTPTNRKPCSYL